MVLLMLSLILNQTILNAKFVTNEITHSDLSSTLIENINGSLSQYGISTSAISKREANRLITQAVDQVYAGKKINLDLEPVVSGLDNSVSQAAAQYGIEGQLPNSVSSGISSTLSASINNQLNTPEVEQFTSIISIVRTVNHLIMIISVLVLLFLIILTVLRRNFVQVFSWIGLWGTIIGCLLIMGLAEMIVQLGSLYPDYSSFTAQLATAFRSQALHLWLIILVLTILLFGYRLLIRFIKRE